MKLLALLSSPAGTRTEQFAPYVAAEANRVWELYAAGLVEEIYLRRAGDPVGPGVVILLQTGGRSDAEDLLASLPLVKAGLLGATLVPLAPLPQLAAALARHHLPLPPWWPREAGAPDAVRP